MTQQYQSDETLNSDEWVFHNHGEPLINRLDSVPHLRDTDTAKGGLSPPRTITPEENMMNIRLLNIDQVCETLNMGRWKVYELIHSNKLRTIKYGSRRLVSIHALRDCISQLEGDSHG